MISRIIFFVCLGVSVTLLITGFIIPPAGIIDGSVLTAVGELFAFATLFQLPAIMHGRSVEFKHGETHVILGDND